MSIIELLKERFAEALRGIVPDPELYLDLIRPSQDSKFGDYQANLAMPIGKKLGKAPQAVAASIIDRLNWSDAFEKPEIAGPGFINIRVRTDRLASGVQTADCDDRLGVLPTEHPKTIIIDFSSPNVAKPMHVGHIRSTIIGNSLAKINRFLGNKVVTDNHLGDWGTQFGMIIYGYKNFLDKNAYTQKPVAELARLYRLVRQIVDYFAAKKTVLDLQAQANDLDAKIGEQKENVKRLENPANIQINCSECESNTSSANSSENVGKETQKKQKDLLKKERKKLEQLQTQKTAAVEKIADAASKIEAIEKNDELFALAQAHPEIGQDVLNETSKLHHGNEENKALWRQFMPFCIEDIDRIYKRLGIEFDYTLGESFYNDRLGKLVDDFKRRGLAQESEGAVCIFIDGIDVPMLIRKKDGAFLYGTTDLATIQYRMETFAPDSILYVVDHRQGLHFEQLFTVAKQTKLADIELKHVKFGTILGDDGRPFKTRSGETVGLEGLLDEAERRALEIVQANLQSFKKTADSKQNSSDGQEKISSLSDSAINMKNEDDLSNIQNENGWSECEIRETARRIGIGALIYADLSQNRESDYVFSYDKMLAMNGNTATYMQYAFARIQSIFTKGNISKDDFRSKIKAATANGTLLLQLQEPAERALAMELMRFSEALEMSVSDNRPNQLTVYLYGLANRYSAFFEKCPVLRTENEDVKLSRLILCDLTAQTIKKGLELLGIETVDRM